MPNFLANEVRNGDLEPNFKLKYKGEAQKERQRLEAEKQKEKERVEAAEGENKNQEEEAKRVAENDRPEPGKEKPTKQTKPTKGNKKEKSSGYNADKGGRDDGSGDDESSTSDTTQFSFKPDNPGNESSLESDSSSDLGDNGESDGYRSGPTNPEDLDAELDNRPGVYEILPSPWHAALKTLEPKFVKDELPDVAGLERKTPHQFVFACRGCGHKLRNYSDNIMVRASLLFAV